jgi:hypothetical protein
MQEAERVSSGQAVIHQGMQGAAMFAVALTNLTPMMLWVMSNLKKRNISLSITLLHFCGYR